MLEISLFYDTEYAWMNLELYDENENFLTSGNMDGDHLYLNWMNDDYSRDIYIKVTGDYEGDWYDLGIKIAGEGDDKNGDNNDPFANFDIPGFPIEIVCIAFIMSTLAIIVFVNKKKH